MAGAVSLSTAWRRRPSSLSPAARDTAVAARGDIPARAGPGFANPELTRACSGRNIQVLKRRRSYLVPPFVRLYSTIRSLLGSLARDDLARGRKLAASVTILAMLTVGQAV